MGRDSWKKGTKTAREKRCRIFKRSASFPVRHPLPLPRSLPPCLSPSPSVPFPLASLALSLSLSVRLFLYIFILLSLLLYLSPSTLFLVLSLSVSLFLSLSLSRCMCTYVHGQMDAEPKLLDAPSTASPTTNLRSQHSHAASARCSRNMIFKCLARVRTCLRSYRAKTLQEQPQLNCVAPAQPAGQEKQAPGPVKDLGPKFYGSRAVLEGRSHWALIQKPPVYDGGCWFRRLGWTSVFFLFEVRLHASGVLG